MSRRQVSVLREAQPGPSVCKIQQAGIGADGSSPALLARRATAAPSPSDRPGSITLPSRAEPAHGSPPGQTGNSPGALPADCPAKQAGLEPVSLATDLPWLTPDQAADRQALNGQLAVLQVRTEDPPNLKDDLDRAVGLLSCFERAILRVDDLLSRLRTTLVSETGWRELYFLLERTRSSLPAHEIALAGMLDQLPLSHPLTPGVAESLQSALRQLIASHSYLTANELPWQDIAKHVEVTLADCGQTTRKAVVESRVIPGTAFGERFANGYSSDHSTSLFDKARSKHVPDLAQTTLTNVWGQPLFRGLHHGFTFLPGVDDGSLKRLTGDELETLVGELVVTKRTREHSTNHKLRIARHCSRIRACSHFESSIALQMRTTVEGHMARETVAAALVSDPDKLQHALTGEAVGVDLFNIALVTWDDLIPWVDQRERYNSMRRQCVTCLQLRGADGTPHKVRASVNVRQFLLSADGQFKISAAEAWLKKTKPGNAPMSRFHIEQLLGPSHRWSLQGDAGAKIDAINADVGKLEHLFLELRRQQASIIRQHGILHPTVQAIDGHLSRLREEQALLSKNARTLKEAGHQLKALWGQPGEWPAGTETSKQVGARLALMGYLMGETPMLSCMSGRDFARQMDAEVKFLATIAGDQDGSLPQIDPDRAVLSSGSAAFAFP